jgi:hypothetical protein
MDARKAAYAEAKRAAGSLAGRAWRHARPPLRFAWSSAEMLMEEQELLSMISFTLKQAAERMTALAAEVRSESVRAQLTELSHRLLHFAQVVDQM